MTKKLDKNLQFVYNKPLYHHIEVVDQESKRILFSKRNILGWQDLEKVLEDWRISRQSNDVDIWIATTENEIELTKKPL
jgi:hypothetical protein